jgi:hypothetical protein
VVSGTLAADSHAGCKALQALAPWLELRCGPARPPPSCCPSHSLQLSNKGGEIRLVDSAGRTAHVVSYTKAQASREGETLLF